MHDIIQYMWLLVNSWPMAGWRGMTHSVGSTLCVAIIQNNKQLEEQDAYRPVRALHAAVVWMDGLYQGGYKDDHITIIALSLVVYCLVTLSQK